MILINLQFSVIYIFNSNLGHQPIAYLVWMNINSIILYIGSMWVLFFPRLCYVGFITDVRCPLVPNSVPGMNPATPHNSTMDVKHFSSTEYRWARVLQHLAHLNAHTDTSHHYSTTCSLLVQVDHTHLGSIANTVRPIIIQ